MPGCISPRPGTITERHGDEIVVAGKFVHTGTPVVTWMDPGGYDAYRVERRFSPLLESSWETSKVAVTTLTTPNRYGYITGKGPARRRGLSAEEIERVRGGGWDLPLLRSVIDQFVYHFDVAGTSRQCFKTLQDVRGLSIHFMLDLDGTIYQTLDVKERAWHATTANDRSIGIEIANIGAYPANGKNPFGEWYDVQTNGTVNLKLPDKLGETGLRMKGFIGHPARSEPVTGEVQGQELIQYDFTPEQYRALIYLTAALCRVFPKLICDYPHDAEGRLITHKLPEADLEQYQGLLGHYHVQTNKVDPGPAFQWDMVVKGARELVGGLASKPRTGQGNARMFTTFDERTK